MALAVKAAERECPLSARFFSRKYSKLEISENLAQHSMV